MVPIDKVSRKAHRSLAGLIPMRRGFGYVAFVYSERRYPDFLAAPK